jgi:single-strand DNA-binding protein
MSLAKITVLGNIGQDAQVREVNGRFAINFSIAHNRKWTDNEGVIRESTTWFNCAIWKESREKTKIAEYLKAGQIVLVEGTPEVRTYKNKDGQTIAALSVNVQEINFAGSAKKEGEKPREPEAEMNANESLEGTNDFGKDPVKDDLPF